ncbi:hypothetical protein H072_1161 [Dactylellina haptotyla CBS 200.50]|uniref:LIM zinc-binding domain-containing protein n=1 Tax=Dactylellina haptotyla (strain CBS 200.50) TaxID=1284197 RepID=S8AV53_DACHA|nr:hypothetical protein H072_1161 [Dactylellina haptotyla CBS 200.50]
MDRVRPSFMTKEQLNKYMTDVKHGRQTPTRPNIQAPTKRLSASFTEQGTVNTEQEDPAMEPITRVQSDTASAFRRFGGSVRDMQRSKGTLTTRNGWIVGGASGRPSPFGSRRQAAPASILEDPGNASSIEKIEEKPVVRVHVHTKEIEEQDKENQVTDISNSPIEDLIEDSISKLQNDISQEIEAVSILLDSPVEEKDPSPSDDYTKDPVEIPQDEQKPDSPAPLKFNRTLPVDIKPSATSVHSSQTPAAPIPVTNNNKVQYQVNALPTPGSTPPELEKRPKFEDRGVPTFTPVAPPTPPTKVMIVEDDKVVGEMTLDDGENDAGFNVQQGKNPNAVVPSGEVSKIASKISELQLKADPYAAAPKPAFPTVTMEEFKERNDIQVIAPVAAASATAPVAAIPAEPKPSEFAFARTNSMPVNLPSQNTPSTSNPVASVARKAYEAPQYKPYRPPVPPTAIPLNNPNPPFLRTRTGSDSIVPPHCPSPAPHSHSSQYSRAIPPHMNNVHGRHSSLGNIYQPGQPMQQPPMQHGGVPAYGVPPQHRQSLPLSMPQTQIQPMRTFQSGPPPLPSHNFQQQPGTQVFFNRPFHGNFQQPQANPSPLPVVPSSNFMPTGRSLPAVPVQLPKALPQPPVITTSPINEPQLPPKQISPVTTSQSSKNQTPPPIPTFSFDEVDTSNMRRLPAVPSQPSQTPKPLPPMPARAVESRSQPEVAKSMPPIPVFSFSDDSTPAVKNIPTINVPDETLSKPSVPILNLPDDDDSDNANPSVPSFSFSGPEEPTDRRPLPTPTTRKQDSRPLPTPRGAPASNSIADRRAAFETHGHSANHRIPMPRSAAACTACGNHISARAVLASGLRFHPECFRCSHCSTRLEHVAFYPEPLGPDAAPDAGPTGRFYCHLDFHEMFSPRCKSCKTPIEGEVVEACGATWHAGHFFCAECGDPFDAQSRFVEKDKYAWCLPCYQKRYSSKCKKCKKPVTDTVVKALDADWHMECFCCFECGSEFQDGRYFLRDGCKNEPVCTKCEEERLKNWELVH